MTDPLVPPVPTDTLADDLLRLVGATGPGTVLKNTQVLVVRTGDVVVKAHPVGTDETDLRRRLDLARRLPGLMLAPHGLERLGDRLVTIWPAGEPLTPADLDPDVNGVPWEEGARLLARLHAQPVPAGTPRAGGPERVARAMAELHPVDAPSEIREAYETLPRALTGATAAARKPTLTHGDWHLGQLVRFHGKWILIDPDDLGAGDPAWDLARPAAWFAAGLLPAEAWDRFLAAYIGAGGCAVPRDDPWRELDLPARALTVQLAATAVATASREGRPLDDAAEALVSSCGRILTASVT